MSKPAQQIECAQCCEPIDTSELRTVVNAARTGLDQLQTSLNNSEVGS